MKGKREWEKQETGDAVLKKVEEARGSRYDMFVDKHAHSRASHECIIFKEW